MTERPLPVDRRAAIDAAVERAIADGRTPGVALAVVDRDGLLVERTYGFADLAARTLVSTDHLFEIGSIGKMFTAIAVLQLAEEGRIEVHAPASEYLPWFSVPRVGDGGPIEIHHLLSHTAGIVAGLDATPEAVFQVRSLADLAPGSAPGQHWHYSNIGYKALGLVLARIEGRPYPEVIRRRVLLPLGMAATEPAIRNEMRWRLAIGYENREDDRIGHRGRALAPATWLETDTADGSIASTAADMAALVRMLIREGEGPSARLLGAGSFAALRAPHARPEPDAAYGYACSQRTIGGRTFIGHGGGMVGYRSAVQVDPDTGIGAVVLQNGPGAGPMALAREVIGIAAGRPMAGPDADSASGSDASEPALLGRWHPDDAGRPTLDIRAAGEGLTVEIAGRATALETLGDDTWLIPDPAFDDALLRLLRPADGLLELWHGADRHLRDGDRGRTLPQAPEGSDRHPGLYRSHVPWTPVFRVVLRGDRLWLLFPDPPDGFEDEQPLEPLPDGAFRVGDDPLGPERLRFDTMHEGRSIRAWLSGWPYYRVD